MSGEMGSGSNGGFVRWQPPRPREGDLTRAEAVAVRAREEVQRPRK